MSMVHRINPKLLVGGFLFCLTGPAVWGQPAPAPVEVLVKGANVEPSGKLKVKSYRIERMKLDKPIWRDRRKVEYSYRLVITGEVFKCPCAIRVDEQPFAAANLGPDQAMITFYEKQMFEDGATVSIADTTGAETVLPERLAIPADMRRPPPKHVIKLRRIPSEPRYGGKPAIQIAIVSPGLLPEEKDTAMIQIGRHQFQGGAYGNQASAIIPEEAFAKLKDDDPVYVGTGSRAEYAGRLNKSSLAP
jgi:hypothetical protein